MEQEIWKDINGYKGLYQVSNSGKIKSLKKILNPWLDKGYLRVGLSKKSKHKYFSVHRLVALHFVSNPKNKPEVNHLDGNKLNNNDWNLEWSTQKENNEHARNILNKPGSNKKLILNTDYGIFYESAIEAHNSFYKNIQIFQFRNILSGITKNTTNLKYV